MSPRLLNRKSLQLRLQRKQLFRRPRRCLIQNSPQHPLNLNPTSTKRWALHLIIPQAGRSKSLEWATVAHRYSSCPLRTWQTRRLCLKVHPRVSATIYQWDPKKDLAAFITNQKSAWDASGFTILEEQPLTLELGLAATEFTVKTPEANVVYLITAIGDRYLVLSGEGNLELVKKIVGRVRPIAP